MRTSTDTGPCSLRARFERPRQLISQPDRSDHYSRPVRPVRQTGQTALTNRSDRSSPAQRQQPNRCRPFRFLLLMKPQLFLRQLKTRNWWIMKRLWSAPTWKSMLCIYLRITSWFRTRMWHIFSLGPVRLCSRSLMRKIII